MTFGKLPFTLLLVATLGIIAVANLLLDRATTTQFGHVFNNRPREIDQLTERIIVFGRGNFGSIGHDPERASHSIESSRKHPTTDKDHVVDARSDLVDPFFQGHTVHFEGEWFDQRNRFLRKSAESAGEHPPGVVAIPTSRVRRDVHTAHARHGRAAPSALDEDDIGRSEKNVERSEVDAKRKKKGKDSPVRLKKKGPVRLKKKGPVRLKKTASLTDVVKAVNGLSKYIYEDLNGAAHFKAYVDEHLHRRQAKLSKVMKSGDAYVLKGNTFNIWKPTVIEDRIYCLNKTSGEVTVKKPGLYYVYAQIMFYDKASRSSAALHVDDEFVPRIECLSFDLLRRQKRSHPDSGHQHTNATGNPEQRAKTRVKRNQNKYQQCNMSGLIKMKKGQRVYIKTIEHYRGILVKGFLTYWGIIKMSRSLIT